MLNYLFESSAFEWKDGAVRLLNVRTKVRVGPIEANRWFSYVHVDFINGTMVLHQGEGCINLSLTLNYQLLDSAVDAGIVMGEKK